MVISLFQTIWRWNHLFFTKHTRVTFNSFYIHSQPLWRDDTTRVFTIIFIYIFVFLILSVHFSYCTNNVIEIRFLKESSVCEVKKEIDIVFFSSLIFEAFGVVKKEAEWKFLEFAIQNDLIYCWTLSWQS